MKILAENDTQSFNLLPGDTFNLTYEEPSFFGRGKKTTLLTHRITEPMFIDRVAVVELDSELADLGMSSGIAGVFGKRADG